MSQTDRQTDSYLGRQTGRKAGRYTEKHLVSQTVRQTSRVGPGVDGQVLGDPPQDLLLRFPSVLPLQQLLVTVRQVELQDGTTHIASQGPIDRLAALSQHLCGLWLKLKVKLED